MRGRPTSSPARERWEDVGSSASPGGTIALLRRVSTVDSATGAHAPDLGDRPSRAEVIVRSGPSAFALGWRLGVPSRGLTQWAIDARRFVGVGQAVIGFGLAGTHSMGNRRAKFRWRGSGGDRFWSRGDSLNGKPMREVGMSLSRAPTARPEGSPGQRPGWTVRKRWRAEGPIQSRGDKNNCGSALTRGVAPGCVDVAPLALAR